MNAETVKAGVQGLKISEDELRSLLVSQMELLSAEDFDKAAALARKLRVPLERALVERSRIPMKFLLEQIASAWEVGFIDLRVNDIKFEALDCISEKYARSRMLIPFDIEDKKLCVAMSDPRDGRLMEEIRQQTGSEVKPYLSPESSIRRALLLYSRDLREMLNGSVESEALSIGGPNPDGQDEQYAVKLIDRILRCAVLAGASDIHIEPHELESLVRYRVDGVLRDVLRFPMTAFPQIVARVKILGGLKLDERRCPQDGRHEADMGGFKVDLRISSLPTQFGEKIVMRLLPTDQIPLDLESLGLTASDFRIVLRNVLRPHGMILITGPTGSGKSTSLYAMIMRVGTERHSLVNISTVEDPIEYTMPRVNQIQLNPKAGMDFPSGLRALLRQDPDVIMVGEIRDRDTADIAVRAAMVGRLLLSTLHTNDATGAVLRLLDIGVEPYLLASTLNLVVGQLLVRKICMKCRESLSPSKIDLKTLTSRPDFEDTIRILRREGVLSNQGEPLAGIRLFRGRGCNQCHGQGYYGRVGLFELFEIDDDIRPMIIAKESGVAIRAKAIAKGMKTLFQDGLAKALLGETTLDEVFRVAL